jgi:predicted permease
MVSRDVMRGLRALRRQPGFTGLVVSILALGIAFVTMVAALAHSVFLGPVPYADPERLVLVWRNGPEPIHQREATSYLNIRDWAAGGEPFFDGLAAYTIATSSIQGAEGATRVAVSYVDPYFFEALDFEMAVGRPLIEADNRPPSGDAVVVLSHGLWQSRFGGDPAILGRPVSLGGHPHTVVGVLSPRSRWLLHEPLEVVAPFRRAAVGMAREIVESRATRSSIVVGRLREGVSIEAARAGMRAVSLALQKEHPDANAGIEANVTSFSELRSDFSRLNDVLGVLAVAAALVFLLSCTSVTLLLLARFVERSRELAVRVALGAAPSRFVRQSLAEGVSLTLAAGALGFALAAAGIRLVFAGNPLNMYGFAEVRVPASVALVTLLAALATTLLFGLVPVLRSARTSFHDALRPRGVGGGGRERNLLRRGLVVAQVAVSVAVLSGAGLLARSLYAFTHTDYGFDTENLVFIELLLDGPRYDAEHRRVAYRELARRVEALPEVTDSGLWGPGRPGSSTVFFSLVPEGRESDSSYEGLHTWIHVLTPGAQQRLGLKLVEGRMIDETDRADSLPTMVISENLSRTLWPGESALGKRVVDPEAGGWRTVVGVVSDARLRGLGRIHSQMLRDAYVAFDQIPASQVNVFLRARGDRAAAIERVRAAVKAMDPTLPVFAVSTMAASLAQDGREIGLITTLMAIFAGVAAILTIVSVYSVISYTSARRTNEIGVRVALGARATQVVALVLGEATLDMALGTTIGIASALFLGRIMSSLLYDVAPTDPGAFALVGAALLSIALTAAFVPVRRALAIDPCQALRQD